MGSRTTVRHARALQRHRFVERPRLYALLDDSKAHVRTLVAPAGYGKTTLAEQWTQRDGRRRAWFTARRASTDVAALALGLATAAKVVVDGCDARLREHLRAAPGGAQNVEVLAELLAEDLQDWPSEAWLVLDDYHEVAAGRDAERFVASLVAAAPVQFLISGRQRASWISARTILYGEILELNQTALAMDATEAADVLGGRGEEAAQGLVALANGWPAVIGLASVSAAEIDRASEPVPESLYRFFAEEVFVALDLDLQQALTIFALAPVLDRDLARALVGPDAGERACAAALEVGLLVERGALLELHPLARSFLEERSTQLGFVPDAEVVERCIDYYRERRDWDAAFHVIARRGVTSALETLLLEALDELLDTARLATIEAWCAFAAESRIEAPAFALARAEVALRRGRHAEAQAHAENAAAPSSPLVFRALYVAGRSAHLASQEEDGLELYKRAEAAASTEAERRDARWGQLICLIELERPEARQLIERLSAGRRVAGPRERVQAASHRIHYQLKFSDLSLVEADLAYQLLGSVRDPLVETSFLSAYSVALGLAARYVEAHRVAGELLDNAHSYRLDFAIPYALCSRANAEAGLRRWRAAEAHLNEAIELARSNRNSHAVHLCTAVKLRVLAQEGRLEAALRLDLAPELDSLPAVRAELLASRALALAASGRIEHALRTLQEVEGTTSALEVRVLTSAIRAVVSVRRRDSDIVGRVQELESVAFSTGALDLLVAAYRTAPEVLTVMLRSPAEAERVEHLIRRVRDEDLANLSGCPIATAENPRERLTPREREVYDLLREGLSNRQIASVLFISEATAKLHVHHVYDKLGIRSRVALRVQAALERADQATSATGTADSSEA